MKHAGIAIAFAAVAAVIGCGSGPKTVEPVPPPNYAANPEPAPLTPLSVNQGPATVEPTGPGASGGYEAPPESYEPEPLPKAPPAQRFYTVRKGDTLWAIAVREYGNGMKWKEIASLNPSVDPRRMSIGQEILLP